MGPRRDPDQGTAAIIGDSSVGGAVRGGVAEEAVPPSMTALVSEEAMFARTGTPRARSGATRASRRELPPAAWRTAAELVGAA